MDLKGVTYTTVDVETYEMIKQLCKTIGVADDYGEITARAEQGKIVTTELNYFDQPVKKVLYDKPFDVEYAKTLMTLLDLTREYIFLPEETKEEAKKDQEADYKTAYKLELRRHRPF